jgi:hypothetical protein
MSSGQQQWIRMNRELFQRDAGEAQSIAGRILNHQEHMLQVQSLIQSTLDGATQKIKIDLRKRADSFFDLYSGPILKRSVDYVRSYIVDLTRYQEQLISVGFSQTLYSVFQNFRQTVDAFMAEKINPEIIGFIGREENTLREYFRTVAAPYQGMVRDALDRYEDALSQFGLCGAEEKWTLNLDPDLDALKQAAKLSLQPAAAVLRYSANIRTEAILRLGAYSLVRAMRKLLKKPVSQDKAEQLRALHDGVRRMKQETERSILAHFKDYQENVKFQYLLRLTDMIAARLLEMLIESFQGYSADLKQVAAAIGNNRSDKERLDSTLMTIEREIVTLKEKIQQARKGIGRLRGSDQEY